MRRDFTNEKKMIIIREVRRRFLWKEKLYLMYLYIIPWRDVYKRQIIDHAIYMKDGSVIYECDVEEERMRSGRSAADLYREFM